MRRCMRMRMCAYVMCERERDRLRFNGKNDNVITIPPTHHTTPPLLPFFPAILTSHLRVTSMVRYFLSSPMTTQ